LDFFLTSAKQRQGQDEGRNFMGFFHFQHGFKVSNNQDPDLFLNMRKNRCSNLAVKDEPITALRQAMKRYK
jgi:hypothetical protein